MNNRQIVQKILIVMNVVVLVGVLAIITMIFVPLRSDATDELKLPFPVPDEYLLSHRVYQELNTSTASYETALGGNYEERVYTSCFEYGVQPEDYEESDVDVLIWGGGRMVDSDIRAVRIQCDTSLEELESIVFGGGGALDTLFTDENDNDVGERGIGVQGMTEGDTIRVFTRGLVEDADEDGRDLLLASVPMSIERENVSTGENSRISGPKEMYLRVAFWVDADTFSDETVQDWSNQPYTYGIKCLDDECTYVDRI